MSQFDRRNFRRYNPEIAGSIAVYAALLFTALPLLRTDLTPVMRAALALSPMIGFALMLRAVARAIQRVDELQRRQIYEIIAWSSGFTMLATFGYGFLEIGLKLPRLSMFAVWMVMVVAAFITSLLYAVTGRGNPFWLRSSPGSDA